MAISSTRPGWSLRYGGVEGVAGSPQAWPPIVQPAAALGQGSSCRPGQKQLPTGQDPHAVQTAPHQAATFSSQQFTISELQKSLRVRKELPKLPDISLLHYLHHLGYLDKEGRW